MRSIKFLLLTLFILLSFTQKMAAQALSENAAITLLTCGPGNELYSVFGHTAIRVYDPENNIDTVYNFGTFDFDTPNFYLKFVKGDLQYYVSVSSYEDFVSQYIYYDRDVYEQVLNLTPVQKQNISTELNSILISDRKFYTYKFIDRNCTTMVADIIAANIEGEISDETLDKGKTNREIIYSRLDNLFYENLGINLMFGYKTDSESYKLFLPNELMEGVSNTNTANGKLAKPATTVYKSKNKYENTVWWNSYYTYAIAVFILMLLTANKVIRLSYLTITGILGVFFLIVGFFSLHAEITQNYNALLFNPLYLLFFIFIFGNNYKAVKATVYLCSLCIILYILFMLNKPHFIMMLPLIVLHVIVLLRVYNRAKKQLKTL